MEQKLVERIKLFLAENELFAGSGATLAQLIEAEACLGVQFDADYREFLALFGGSYVGVPIYGFNACDMLPDTTVTEVTLAFRKAYAVDARWPVLAESCVLSMTGSGDPVILDPAGKVRVYFHDSNEEEILAASFQAFIEYHLPR